MDLTLKNGSLIRQKQVPSPHFNPRPNINDISLLVIHYISLPPEQFGEHFIDDFFKGNLIPMPILISKKSRIYASLLIA